MTIGICHLWPDALNWNGSRGNLICLKKRLEWRGIPVEVHEIPVGSPAEFEEYDLVYIGAGKAYENHALLRDVNFKSDAMQRYASDGGTVFAVCEGFELLGKIIALPDGTAHPGLGVIPMKTVYGNERHTGNAAAETAYGKLVYFENSAGLVYPDEEVSSLGRMIHGYGNNGLDGFTGVHFNNVFGCQAHGPLLPKNPGMADEILRSALFRNHPELELLPLDDNLEDQARHTMEERIL